VASKDFVSMKTELAPFKKRMRRLGDAAPAVNRRAVLAGGQVFASALRVKLHSGARTGRVYVRGKGRFHVASAPGEPPATDTGVMANTVRVDLVKATRSDAIADVGPTAEQAPILEFGGGSMLPRPFMRVTRDEQEEAIRSTIVNMIRTGIAKAAK